jgi:hypothetical protein
VLEHTHPQLHFGFCTYHKCSLGKSSLLHYGILPIPRDTIPICAKSRNAIPFFAAHSSTPNTPLSIPSPKRRRHRIPHHQLLPLLETLSQPHVSLAPHQHTPHKTHRPQIPHALIQRRRKNTPDITKHTLMLLDTQLAAQEAHNRFKALVCREFEDALREVRGGADGLEADGYYSQIIKLILNDRYTLSR